MKTKPFNLEEAKAGKPTVFRSGGEVKFVAHIPTAKEYCRLIFLNPKTGIICSRYENGTPAGSADHRELGDILMVVESKVYKFIAVINPENPDAIPLVFLDNIVIRQRYCDYKIIKEFEITVDE